jgi:hypothetical protein
VPRPLLALDRRGKITPSFPTFPEFGGMNPIKPITSPPHSAPAPSTGTIKAGRPQKASVSSL